MIIQDCKFRFLIVGNHRADFTRILDYQIANLSTIIEAAKVHCGYELLQSCKPCFSNSLHPEFRIYWYSMISIQNPKER